MAEPAQFSDDLRTQVERLLGAGKAAEALPLAERIAAHAPGDAVAWTMLGVALRASGRAAAAIAAYRRALEITPDAGGVHSNLGNALKDAGRLDEAVAAHYRAVQIEPRNPTTWQNLAVTLRERGDLDDALAALQHVLNLAPESVTAHSDRAQILLMRGEFAEGWREFEWRWKLKELRPQNFRQPRWTGAPLPDATILLWPEQGFGDTILGARYIPLVKERVGRVVLGCKPELRRLFADLPGVDELVMVGDKLPDFDVHSPLLSLPGLFETEFGNIPPPAQLSVSDAARAKLAAVLAPHSGRLRVGIVWSGSLTFRANHLRASTLDRFLGFAEAAGVQLFSLQKGPRARDLDTYGARGLVVDLAPHLDDFADTAAAVEALDLVLMTDSSVAHLAASLGRPVWNLLAFMPYWLYLTGRSDSPWYPSMRLFRQPRPGDWESVFREAKAALAARAAEHSATNA